MRKKKAPSAPSYPGHPVHGGAASGREGGFDIMGGFRIAGRLIIPVAALVGVFALAYALQTISITQLDRFPASEAHHNPGSWLTAGHLVVPLSLFVIHLTNRAYGAGYAVAQSLIAWAIVAVAVQFFPNELAALFPAVTLPAENIRFGFAGALIGAHMIAIMVFDLTRGPVWWQAPFYAGVIGSLVYVVVFHPLAAIGVETPWLSAMVADGAIKVGMAIVLLAPYYVMRGMIRPKAGYGGA